MVYHQYGTASRIRRGKARVVNNRLRWEGLISAVICAGVRCGRFSCCVRSAPIALPSPTWAVSDVVGIVEFDPEMFEETRKSVARNVV